MSIEDELDEIYQRIDDYMWASNLTEIDNIFVKLQLDIENNHPDHLNADIILGYLVSSWPIADKLIERKKYIIMCEQAWKDAGIWEDNLFDGLY